MSTKGKRNVEAMVESIQKSIQEGAPKLPWNRPWELVGQKSIKTGHTYQGGNGFITAILADFRGWGPGWGTYKQLVGFTGKEKLPGVLVDYKGSLRGQTGIALLRPIFRKEFDETKGKEVQRLVGFAEFVAFNVTQVRYGGKEPAGSAEARLGRIRLEAAKRALVKVEIREHRPIDQAEATIRSFAAGLRGGFHVSDGSNSAHYVPFTDTIRVPNPERFATAAAYYSTVFHECAHATGAEHRLARFKSDEFPGRGRLRRRGTGRRTGGGLRPGRVRHGGRSGAPAVRGVRPALGREALVPRRSHPLQGHEPGREGRRVGPPRGPRPPGERAPEGRGGGGIGWYEVGWFLGVALVVRVTLWFLFEDD
jgi:antirestriction protein ArdC